MAIEVETPIARQSDTPEGTFSEDTLSKVKRLSLERHTSLSFEIQLQTLAPSIALLALEEEFRMLQPLTDPKVITTIGKLAKGIDFPPFTHGTYMEKLVQTIQDVSLLVMTGHLIEEDSTSHNWRQRLIGVAKQFLFPNEQNYLPESTDHYLPTENEIDFARNIVGRGLYPLSKLTSLPSDAYARIFDWGNQQYNILIGTIGREKFAHEAASLVLGYTAKNNDLSKVLRENASLSELTDMNNIVKELTSIQHSIDGYRKEFPTKDTLLQDLLNALLQSKCITDEVIYNIQQHRLDLRAIRTNQSDTYGKGKWYVLDSILFDLLLFAKHKKSFK